MKLSKEYIHKILVISHTHTHTHTHTNFKVLKAYNKNCEQLQMLRQWDITEMKSRQCWAAKKLNSYRILLAKL